MKSRDTDRVCAPRPTIGALLSITDRHQPLWVGAVDAALARDANLICFVGGTLPASGQPQVTFFFPHTLPSTSFFDLVDETSLDGLITWAGSGVGLGMHLSDAQMHQFIARYRSLPIVNYEGFIEGISSITTDTYLGMCELIAHMIDVHACRRIAFIRGPAHHMESEERYRAYLDTLGRYGIPITPTLISPPAGWGQEVGAQMIDVLLDTRGLCLGVDIDAIVTSEIEYAIGALQALQSRGVRVPDQVAVASFNDRVEAQLSHPPITAMRKPFYESGFEAVQAVLDRIQGKPIPDTIPAPPRLVIRRSCGCWAIQKPIAGSGATRETACGSEQRLDERATELRANLVAQLQRLASLEQARSRPTRLVPALIEILIAPTASDVERRQRDFWNVLEAMLREPPAREDLAQWHAIIAELFHYLDSILTHDALLDSDDNPFWRQVQIIVGQELRHAEVTLRTDVVEDSRVLLSISQEMMSAQDVEHLLDVLARRLPELGISGCYLSFYEDLLISNTPQLTPEWSRLVLALQEGRRIMRDPPAQRFRSRQLAPDGLLPSDHAYALIATPLHFGQQMFGFALFQVGPHNGRLYLLLAQEISSALQSVFLLREYQQSEHARRESEARMRTLIEHMPVAFWVKDTGGKYIMQNSAMRALAGNNLGLTLDEIMINDALRSKWKAEDARVFGGETIYTQHALNRDGQERVFHQVVAPVQVDDQITAILGLMFDMTEQKQLEASLRQAKEAAEAAYHAKSIFLANMSHELRTPLNGILGYAQILQQTPSIAPQQQRGLNAIQKSGEYLLMLINDILDLAKFEAGKASLNPQPYCLLDTILNVCDIIRNRAEAKQLIFSSMIGPLPQIVVGDDKRLRQVLINLLDNAIKFTSQGSVTLLAQALPTGHLRFQVSDTGIGIAHEHLDLIFAPFEQVSNQAEREKGTGLGLAIARELVDLMGGVLQVASEPGRGSSFWFDILLPEIVDPSGVTSQLPAPAGVSASWIPGTSLEAENAGGSWSEMPPASPPASILSELIELAQIGDVAALQQRVTLLLREQPDLVRFLTVIRQLADDFQINLLLAFLESHREVRP
jgi:PAS domain S-box-containing protein